VRAIDKSKRSSSLWALALFMVALAAIVVSVLLFVAGERRAKPEYAFDLECKSTELNFEKDMGLDVFVCSSPYFRITCEPKSVQHTRDGWYCKTSGSESVRIRMPMQ